ncbi:LysR family transcriptional regulator [Hydrocarboniclastica marina]|uniref:LysR family transcriptional regulator n=1 Tax=Hydrocarboniclastica marina TaxID=2259620 RepID=UPI001FE82FA5|nr:LysR family transcriptional regulator [Hydrocarboniclastica marina]
MDIELLKTFLEVGRIRHFGRAAENLYLTQSAVSARIRQLEQVLGTELFNRTRNNIQLTASGERLLPHAEAALAAWEQGRQAVSLSADRESLLTLAAAPSLWDSRGQQALGRLRAAMPELGLRAESHPDSTLARRLLELQVDLILCYDPPKRYDVIIHELSPLRLILVTNQAQLNLSQALGPDYLYVDWGASFSGKHATVFAAMPSPRVQIGSGRLALDLLLAEGGAVYLPEPVVEPYLSARRLFRVEKAPVFERGVHLAYRRGAENAAMLEQVVTLIAAAGWRGAESLQLPLIDK